MGSVLLVRTFAHCDKTKLLEQVDNQIDSDAHQDGHLYSGSWGVKYGKPIFARENNPFESVREAEEFIENENDKHGPLHAVLAYEVPPLPADLKSEKLSACRTRRDELRHRSFHFTDMVRAEAAKLKSEFKSCQHCSSKINLKRYLSAHRGSLNCPVCTGPFLWKPAHDIAKKRLEADIEKAVKAVEDQEARERKKLKLERRLVWVVGGFCAS
jgi:uncharacterized CHY-type Zn-finger protein